MSAIRTPTGVFVIRDHLWLVFGYGDRGVLIEELAMIVEAVPPPRELWS